MSSVCMHVGRKRGYRSRSPHNLDLLYRLSVKKNNPCVVKVTTAFVEESAK